MLHAFANLVVAEGIAMDDVFANGAISQPVDVTVHHVKDDGAFTILNGVDVVARRSIKAVPAAVVTADQAGRIDRSGYALTARRDGELIVHQKVSIGRIADLDEAAAIEFLFERSRNAVTDDVVFPIRVALVGRDVVIVGARARWPAFKSVPRGHGATGSGRRSGGAPGPGHVFANRDGGIAIDDDMVIAAGQSNGGESGQECESYEARFHGVPSRRKEWRSVGLTRC